MDLKTFLSPKEWLALRWMASPGETIKHRPLTRAEIRENELVYTIARLTEAIVTTDEQHARWCLNEAVKIIDGE